MALDSDLTLAATLATELGVASGDAKLPRYIAAASAAIRGYLCRSQLHYSAANVETLQGFGRVRLILGLTPVVSITSIEIDDSEIDEEEYSLEDAALGLVYRQAGWPFTGLVRGALTHQDVDPGTEEKVITATYAGGWVTPYQAASGGWAGPARSLPFEIEEACIQTAVSLYRRSGIDQAIASESLGDYSVSYRASGPTSTGGIIPDSVLPQLDAYRRLV